MTNEEFNKIIDDRKEYEEWKKEFRYKYHPQHISEIIKRVIFNLENK